LSILECAKKELEEEAGLTEDMKYSLKPVGAISYAYCTKENGVNIEGEFAFDVKLPNDFMPMNKDGEVESFSLMNISQVKEAIIRDDFKPNSAAITLDFVIRKGLLAPDESN
jgi:8-oxo-dGTP pyrophosphatase MutT (NUDIX family)